jgi:hypothetical protein
MTPASVARPPAPPLGPPPQRPPAPPLLAMLPVGLWVFSLACDLLYLGGAEAEIWSRLALYAMVGGVIAAFTTLALPGFVSANVTLVVLALYAVNIWLRVGGPASLGLAIALSMTGVGTLAVLTWLGHRPVVLRKE